MIIPVILCGGAGTRLWPASRDSRPKPFLPLIDGGSTFAATLHRIADPTAFGPPIVVANREHRFLVAAALAEADVVATLLLEPEARDTAAAIAAAAELIARRDPNAIMLVLAADHLIRDVAGFRATIVTATPAAEAGHIVVFGVKPTGPSTSYGYIRRGEPVAGLGQVEKVAAFVEKPDEATAEEYVKAGYLWNSGNFMMRASVALNELKAHAPKVLEAAAAALPAAKDDEDTVELAGEPFKAAPRIAFDRAVMEKTDRAVVVETGFDWSDLGTWHSVWDSAAKDDGGNVSAGDVIFVGARGSYASTDRPLIGVVGVEDIVVVASDDQILVVHRSRSDAVKDLVAALAKREEPVIGDRARHYRPWGYYQSLDVGDRHQVKRIVVNPGARLSLQKHRHRAEHWTVVDGVAEVTVDEDVKTLKPNESVYIPLGAVHRMANPGKTPMTLIEVQCGDYLGEDDIVRLQDDYGRIPG